MLIRETVVLCVHFECIRWFDKCGVSVRILGALQTRQGLSAVRVTNYKGPLRATVARFRVPIRVDANTAIASAIRAQSIMWPGM